MMKVVSLEILDNGKIVGVKLKGQGETYYSDMAFIYLKSDSRIPVMGEEFTLLREFRIR